MARARRVDGEVVPGTTARPLWIERLGRAWPSALQGDVLAILTLLAIAALFVWLRVSHTPEFFRGDILTQFLPYYTAVSDRLRAGDLPGWNPTLFSGMPLAGDPISGWGYLPVLASFFTFPTLTAYKVHVAFHLVGAGVATYLFARTIGLGPFGALTAGIAFLLGPHYHFAQCCTARMQLGPWIPLGLLTIELAVRSRNAATRLLWWGLTGVVISQMIAGYFGKGTYYGILTLGAYLAYRTLIDTPRPLGGLPRSMGVLAVHSAAVLCLGAAFSAATVLPRLDFLSKANLAGGSYEAAGAAAVDPPAWPVERALSTILDPSRPAYFVGTATFLLAMAGVVLAWRRFATPFFAVFSAGIVVLTLEPTPLHHLMYLLPKFQVIHEHAPQRVLVVLNIGPAMLAGAAVAAVERRLVRPWQVVLAALTCLAVVAVVGAVIGFDREGLILALGETAAMAASLLGLVALAMHQAPRWRWGRLLPLVAATVLTLFLFADLDNGRLWRTLRDGFTTPPTAALGLAYADREGTDDAGGFLKARQEAGEFFRYYGYNSAFLSAEKDFLRDNYRRQWRDPMAEALLVNNRALALGVHDIQGYNPVHYMGYVQFMNAVNGRPQEYHETNVLPSGITSPLLALLNVRYVVVPTQAPTEGSTRDWVYLTTTYREVFRNGQVRVLEIPNPLPRAWIVHEARQAGQDESLALLASEAVDPRRTALLVGEPPATEALPTNGADEVTITNYQADRIRLTATTDAAGILVLSEIYDPGWKVIVAGEPAKLYQADGILRAVALPKGTHTVELLFEPASLTRGVSITAVTGVAVTLSILFLWWRSGGTTPVRWPRVRGLRQRASSMGRGAAAVGRVPIDRAVMQRQWVRIRLGLWARCASVSWNNGPGHLFPRLELVSRDVRFPSIRFVADRGPTRLHRHSRLQRGRADQPVPGDGRRLCAQPSLLGGDHCRRRRER